jgi:hypothetical protein
VLENLVKRDADRPLLYRREGAHEGEGRFVAGVVLVELDLVGGISATAQRTRCCGMRRFPQGPDEPCRLRASRR